MLQKDNRHKVLSLFFDNPLPDGAGFQLREISRKTAIAPPSVKNYLLELEKEGLITKKKHRVHSYPIYYSNRDNEDFRYLKKIDNAIRIKESGLLDYLWDTCMPDVIIVFGSFANGEDLQNSDVDLFVLSQEEKLDLEQFEKFLNRKIHLFFCKDFGKLSKELKNNIINGVILRGYLNVY